MYVSVGGKKNFMYPKDVALTVVVGLMVNTVSVISGIFLARTYALEGPFMGPLIGHVVVSIISILVYFFALMSVPAKAITKLSIIAGCQFLSMLLGLFGSAWALGMSANTWKHSGWILRKESATALCVTIGMCSFCQLILVFFIIKSRESLVLLRRQNALDNIPLSTQLCGDYEALGERSEEEEYEDDAEFSGSKRKKKRRKPSFKNRHQNESDEGDSSRSSLLEQSDSAKPVY